MLSAVRAEYRTGEVFPGEGAAEGYGPFLIPIRVADEVDRTGGRVTLVMGDIVSVGAAKIQVTPMNAATAAPHLVSVRVWSSNPLYTTLCDREQQDEILAAIDRAWQHRQARPPHERE